MLKRLLCYAFVGVVCLTLAFSPDFVFAQAVTPETISTDNLVSWTGLSNSILNTLKVPFAAMVGIGLSFAIAYAGYKFIRYRAL
jgi:hypothetical protein